jgi:PAS domain S-box-containing protein
MVMVWKQKEARFLESWCHEQRALFTGVLPLLILNGEAEWPGYLSVVPFQPCEICPLDASAEELSLRLHLLSHASPVLDQVQVFMDLFRKHSAVMFMLDAYTGEIVEANASAENFYGYSVAQLQQMKVFDLNQAKTSLVQEKMQAAYDGVLNRFCFHHRLANGDIRFVEINTTSMLLNGRAFLFTVIQDQTSRQEAERALEITEARYRQMIETAEEGIITLNAEDEITFVNQKMLTLLAAEHYPHVLGKTFDYFLTPEAHIAYLEQKQRLKQGIKETQDLQLLTLQQEEIWVSASMSTLFSSADRFDGVMCFVTNIQGRKQWEKDMESALKERGVLLQEVNHRVKNNFQLMLSMLRLQQRRAAESGTDHAMLDAAAARLYTMALVHEQIYEKQGLVSLHFKQFMRLLVREVSAYENTCKPRVDFQLEDLVLNLDEAIVCSLILNEWLKNAYQHAFKNVDHPWIGLSFFRERTPEDTELVTLSIEDNGCGFDLQQVGMGTGMGVTLAQHWALQLSGTVTVSSDARGTRCSFSFPRQSSS